jgi:hypothetical protein
VAGALRPVVLVMLFASLLFIADGVLDGVYPGGPGWFTGRYGNLGEISYLFALVNTGVALMVALGSERSLISRIGLSVFFLVERPLTAFVLGPKPVESVVVHFSTALVELVILVSALRVWRLGRGPTGDVDALFALGGSPPAAPPSVPVAPSGNRDRVPKNALGLGSIAVGVAMVLVADGVHGGFVPGGRAWTASGEGSGWLVYLFAAVLIAIAARAVNGGTLFPKALIAVALVLFIERSFSSFAAKAQDPIALALHGLAALGSLGLALATANLVRTAVTAKEHAARSLEAA